LASQELIFLANADIPHHVIATSVLLFKINPQTQNSVDLIEASDF